MNYRILWALAAAGVALHLLGLGWDAYLHARDSSLAAREGVFTLTNPSHLLAIAGLALTATAVAGVAMLWMHEQQFGGRSPAARTLRAAGLPAVGLVAAGALWLGSLAEENTSHNHADEHTEALVHAADGTHPADAPAVAATNESHGHPADPMGEGNAHFHSPEVATSPEQLVAAAAFYEATKANAARFEDVREALAAGYIQITQDLPGIAAHFLHPAYNTDGRLMDPELPESLLYTKRLDGTWRLVGVMYSSEQVTDEPPAFFGALDAWHRHENLCFTATGVTVTESASACRGGLFVKTTPWNLHVWTAPGATGVFAHDFPPIDPGAYPGATQYAARELVRR